MAWSDVRKLLDEMKAAVEAGADIPELEKLTTEIDFMVRQESFRGMEVEVTRDGGMRFRRASV